MERIVCRFCGRLSAGENIMELAGQRLGMWVGRSWTWRNWRRWIKGVSMRRWQSSYRGDVEPPEAKPSSISPSVVEADDFPVPMKQGRIRLKLIFGISSEMMNRVKEAF